MIPIIALAGSAYRKRATVTISANTTNYTLSTSSVSGYVAGATDVTLVINSNVWVYSLDATLPALTIDSSFAAGDSILVQNNGYIFGGGGTGAGFTYTGGVYVPTAGQNGGSAISTAKNFSLINTSYIGGGGGGGGGVQAGASSPYSITCGGGGAGGGAGGYIAGYLPNGATTVNTNGGNGASFSQTGIAVSYSGGGGGLKVSASQTTGPYLLITTTGASNGIGGYGAAGGGTGAVMGYNEYIGSTYGYGGTGGASNGPGGNGVPIQYSGNGYIRGGGGGGGWGGAGGAGAFYGNPTNVTLLAAGAAGKGIALNGNTVNIITSNTIWGAVA